MSVRFWTGNPRGLLYALEQAVHDGQIATWVQNTDGDFTHASEFLRDKAYMRAKIYRDSLAFAIIGAEGHEITDQLFGLYQACLIQAFLTSFADRFTLADVSSDFRDRDGDRGRTLGPQGIATTTPQRISA